MLQLKKTSQAGFGKIIQITMKYGVGTLIAADVF